MIVKSEILKTYKFKNVKMEVSKGMMITGAFNVFVDPIIILEMKKEDAYIRTIFLDDFFNKIKHDHIQIMKEKIRGFKNVKKENA